MSGTAAVILAAGKGKRMRSKYPKVLHFIAGKPMLEHVMDTVSNSGISESIVVLGYKKEDIIKNIGLENYVIQEQQLGTGHAVYQTNGEFGNNIKDVVILCGDTPLITEESLSRLTEHHKKSGAAATVLTAETDYPEGYGRIVRGHAGGVEKIVEQKDASEEEIAIKEINSGTYIFNKEKLYSALELITPDNAQCEYYLTDVIKIFVEQGELVAAAKADDAEEILGINDRVQLARAEKIISQRKNRELMLAGVTIIDPESTFIDSEVKISEDSIIYPNTMIQGGTEIDSDCLIGPSAVIRDCTIGEGTHINCSFLQESTVGDNCKIGPYAHLRPGTFLEGSNKVGNFVELKKSKIGKGSKIPHLSYIGDADVGKDVNIGAGTITCNYDGEKKWQTVIRDGAFIGSNSNIVAPLEIGKGAFVAAGSTITEDVPEKSLGIGRERQRNVEGWVERKMKKNK